MRPIGNQSLEVSSVVVAVVAASKSLIYDDRFAVVADKMIATHEDRTRRKSWTWQRQVLEVPSMMMTMMSDVTMLSSSSSLLLLLLPLLGITKSSLIVDSSYSVSLLMAI